jgi:hypothetical protein
MWFIFSISNLKLWFIDLYQWVAPILNIRKHKKYFSFLLMYQEKKSQASILKTKRKRMFKKISNNLD